MQKFAPKIIFPVHPRTRKKLEEFKLKERVMKNSALALIEPVGYMPFLALQDKAAIVLTDSGGIQEETTALGVPCVTLRDNTERPVTIIEGTNVLAGRGRQDIVDALAAARHKAATGARVPELWDGHAGERIVNTLADW